MWFCFPHIKESHIQILVRRRRLAWDNRVHVELFCFGTVWIENRIREENESVSYLPVKSGTYGC